MGNKKKKLSQRALAKQIEKNKKFDPKVTADDCLTDLLALQKERPFEIISRDFYRINGKYAESTWTKHFGTFAQFKRKAGLEKSRLGKKIEHEIALHDDLDIFRKFYDVEVKPYYSKYERKNKAKGIKLLLIGSDFHDIDSDPFMLGVFIDTAKRLQPDNIILNGDVFDLYEFSRFEIDPRVANIPSRFKFVRENIFRPLRKACPKAEIDLIVGNHEFRLMKLLADKTPALKILLHDVMGLTLADIFGLDEFQINLVAKIDLGAFRVSDVNAELKQNYKVYYNCYTASHEKDWGFGTSGTSAHTHRPEIKTETNIPLGKLSWMNTGSIARTPVCYQEGKNTYVQGFGIAHVDPDKQQVTQELILVTGDFAVVGGKYYHRK